jgi:hypothetical protein
VPLLTLPPRSAIARRVTVTITPHNRLFVQYLSLNAKLTLSDIFRKG